MTKASISSLNVVAPGKSLFTVKEFYLALKAALELLTSRFKNEGAQPACMKTKAHTGNQSFYAVQSARGKELSQMILRPLSRNITQRPRDLTYLSFHYLDSK